MLAKKLKLRIGEDKKIQIYVTDMPSGEVEIIILRKEKGWTTRKEILSKIPMYKAGKILKSLGREDIYTSTR